MEEGDVTVNKKKSTGIVVGTISTFVVVISVIALFGREGDRGRGD